MTIKICVRCKTHKPIDQFWKEIARPDGHKAACIECIKKDKLVTPEERAQKKEAFLMATTKVCRICKKEKPKSEFRIEWGNKDKLNNACMPCYDGNRRAQYQKNPVPHAESVKKWREQNKEKDRAFRNKYSKKFKEANPLIVAAWGHTTYAIKTGRLKKTPCEICNNPKVEAHHPSHKQEHWLNVQFLCALHHGRANKMKGFKYYTKELDAEYEKRNSARRSRLVCETTSPPAQSGEQ